MPAIQPGTNLPSGAVAYYSFDNVSDMTVYNDGLGGIVYDGLLEYGAAITTGGGGIIGEGMTIADETTQKLTAKTGIDLADTAVAGGAWTIATWFYNLYPSDDWRILTRGGGDFQVMVYKGNDDLETYVGGFRDSNYDLSPGGGWHHLVAVGTGSETRFYIDGAAVGEVIPFRSGTEIKWIGNYSGQAFAEIIDEFYVYDRALSEAEIGQFVTKGATQIMAPTVDLQNGPPLEESLIGPDGDGKIGGLYGIWLRGDGEGGDPDYRWSIKGGPEALPDTLLAELPDTDLDGAIDDYFLTFAQLAEVGAMDRDATAPYTLKLEALDSGGVPIAGSESEILLFIPEPTTLTLLAVGGLALLHRRRIC